MTVPLLPPAAQTQAEPVVAHLCRRRFSEFVREFWPEVPGAGEYPEWNWHMDVVCDELQKVAERVFRGLPKEYDVVLNISPGTSKSTLCSILFPAWTWTRMPSCRILSATHTDMLALDLAAKSRTVVKSEKYQSCFPDVVLRSDQDTKSYFANTKGGDRMTCTVGGKSPMGFHAHFIIPDDPIDPKKVMSELELKTAKEFMTQIIPTRKVDKAVSVIFLVMQRLHEEDPAGVMLERNAGDPGAVRHVCLPAELAENVTPPELKSFYVDGLMDPRRLGRPVLTEIKKTLSAYAYAGQFGQNPVPLGGGMFKDFYFNQRVKAAPYQAKRIRYWDRACLVSGTMIQTSQGPKPIERVEVGELVLTRNGYRPVTFSGETKRVRSVLSVLFHSGSIVTGTHDHRVWTENRGWVPLGELTKDDTALCCHETGMSWDERSPVAWPVVSVPRTFDEDVPVYDLTVEGEHEFFANGILVHNSTQDGGCFTAGVLMAKDSDGNYFVEHCVWGQWEPYERNQRMLATAIRDRARYGPKHEPVIHVEAEGGSSGRDAWKGVVRDLAGFYIKEDRVTGDKVTRANPWSAQLAAKNVFFVDDGTWDLDGYVREHCSFPLGKYKDQVDASSGAFNLLTGVKFNTEFRVIQIRPATAKDSLRLVVATPESLPTVAVEERTLLVVFKSLLDDDAPPKHGIINLGDTLTLKFEALQPSECQQIWGEPVEPFNLPAVDLIMNREHGKKFWSFLLKKRDPPASVVVFVDDKNRALSACYAACDVLRSRLPGRPRPQVFQVGQKPEDTHQGDPENRHVYDTVRACRSLVI